MTTDTKTPITDALYDIDGSEPTAHQLDALARKLESDRAALVATLEGIANSRSDSAAFLRMEARATLAKVRP